MSDELNQEVPASWEVPSEPEAHAEVEVVDTPAEPELEPELEQVAEVVYTPAEPAAEPAAEAPAAETAKSKKLDAAAANYQDGEVVMLSKLVLGGNERNSRSVALIQERLISQGYSEVDMDRRGSYKENTHEALLDFCGDEGINESTVKKLFANTKVSIAY